MGDTIMIRIGNISDSHWDERYRIQDNVDVHRAFLRQAHDAEVDLIIHSGDFFERRSNALERTHLADWLQAATEIAPIYGVRGNHDAPSDLEVFNRLKTRFPIRIEERSTAHPGSAWMVEARGIRIGCLGLAWIDKANLVAGLDATVDAEQTRQLTIEAAQDLLTCLRSEATRLRKEGAIPILVAHVMLGGSVVSTGQVLIGQGIELSPSDLLDVGCAYAAVGHVHASQQWFDGRVAYAGSPNRCTFGEEEPKGWRLVTIDDDGTFLKNEFVELPARRIVLLEADWSSNDRTARLRDSGINICFAISEKEKIKEIKGALVRFRYHIRSQDLHLVDEAKIEKIFLADGAEQVKIECVVEHDAHARAPEIVKLTSVADKFDAFLRAKDIDMTDEQLERLRAKLSLLEGGDHATQ